MKTLLVAGALVLALISGVARNPAALADPNADWARIVHTIR